jgi:hypothetical protein
MFSQMMQIQQQVYQALNRYPVPAHHDTTTTLENRSQALGKRNATDDLETVIDADQMETDDQDNSRKRSDSQQTPQKVPPPADSQQVRNNIEPRQLLAPTSPCNVPLPESPATVNRSSELSVTAAATEEEKTGIAGPPRTGKQIQYQQQSMSQYLSEATSTNISKPPDVIRVHNDLSKEVNQASLSEVEDDSRMQGSGNEGETPTTPISNNRRRGSTGKQS